MKKAEFRRLTRKMREDLARDYVPTGVALTVTGISSLERLLVWCKEKNVRHIMRQRRWLFHKADLLEGLK